jgi:hypothetical protein
MRYVFTLALAGAFAATAAAQPPAGPSPRNLALVSAWWEHFMGQPPDTATAVWAQNIDKGTPPDKALAAILSSPDYYARSGGTPESFVSQMFIDLSGRPPTRDQLLRWSRRLVLTGDVNVDVVARMDLAHDLLMRYPQAWQAAPPPPPDYDRDRGHDRGDWDRDRRYWDRDDDYDYRRPYYPPIRRDWDRDRRP